MPKPVVVKSLLQMCLHCVSLRLSGYTEDENVLAERSRNSFKEDNRLMIKCDAANPFAELRRLHIECW